METIQSINLITTNPHVRNGRPCIAGTTIEIAVIATAKIMGGREPEEIASDHDLSLPQVYTALAYYYENKASVDETIEHRYELAASFKEARVGSRHQPLFSICDRNWSARWNNNCFVTLRPN